MTIFSHYSSIVSGFPYWKGILFFERKNIFGVINKTQNKADNIRIRNESHSFLPKIPFTTYLLE